MSSKILGPKGRTAPKFDDNDHDSLISRFPILTTPNDWNHVVFFEVSICPKCVIGCILKCTIKVLYIHESSFLCRGVTCCLPFLMSSIGSYSRVNLVKHMQLGGSLEDAWLMFDHMKRIHGWTTIACHMYDLAFKLVLTTTICDRQYKDSKS